MIQMTTKNKRLLNRDKNVIKGHTLNYNAALQRNYHNQIMILVNDMTFTTTLELSKLFSSKAFESFLNKQNKLSAIDEDDSDKSISSQARILINSLIAKFSYIFNKRAKLIAKEMLRKTKNISLVNLNFSFGKMKDGLSIKKEVLEKGTDDISKSIIEENITYINSLQEKYFTDVSGSVMRAISEGGDGIKSLIPDSEKIINHSEKKSTGILGKYNLLVSSRAARIAYDQTRKAYTAINKQGLMNAGIKEFEWVYTYESRYPRHSHIKIDGEIFSFDNLLSEQAALGVPSKDRGLPGFPANCFTGSTIVSLANGCRNLWRYMYRGDMVSISFNGGEIIECTPNHPILTLRGWIPANNVNEGDYLVSCQAYDNRIIDNKKTKITTTFADLFYSIEASGSKFTDIGSKFNFHGDVPEVDVDTIITDNCLPFWDKSIGDEDIEKLFLTFSDLIINNFIPGFMSKIVELGSSGGFAQKFSFVNGEFRHSDFTSDTSIPENNSFPLKDTINFLPTNFIENRDRLDAFSFIISCDNFGAISIHSFDFNSAWQNIINSIPKGFCQMTLSYFINFAKLSQSHSLIQKLFRVEKKVSSIFEGHVYTMESYNGWFNVSSTEITSKNCKCKMRAIFRF